ncbi:nuclease-related domain-containing protein [Gracilibacillus alcaliphilus]|uniref:nuclease-related domain-containing protein n=1 Tax=Gracilibacillus alcaliphilus TaxID=1401441 RepID=UPI0019577965|nr:nuclease-related domain-containing protein [Gracilibacillus alcaliphilus]MBM7679822.1 hypothetical protein [Gracilibacillus alcaliphilus]
MKRWCIDVNKKLTKSHELRIYEALEGRYPFSSDEKLSLANLQQGYHGERQLEQLLHAELVDSHLVISDLRLQVGTTTFQIDSLICTKDKLYLLEVKHYAGDYKCEEMRWYKLPNKEITNPVLQLQRSESLLRRWLHDNRLNLQLESYLVFTNCAFFLYQAPLTKQIVLPTQLRRFIQLMNQQSATDIKQRHQMQLLLNHDLGAYPHPSVPSYAYDQLKKGVRCVSCRSLSMDSTGQTLKCLKCMEQENIQDGVMRNIAELQLLLPQQKLTSQLVYDWCDRIYSIKSIKRLLDKHFTAVGQHSWVHYIHSYPK